MRGATLVITAAALLGCAARTPRSAVGVRCVSRPPLRALRLQGGSSEPAADDEEDEEAAEAESDRDAAEEPDEDAEDETPEVEEPDDEDAEPAPVSAASAPQAALGLNAGSLKASARSMLSSLGLVPSTPSGEGSAEGEQEEEGDMTSTLLTVAVFVGFRVLLSLAVRFFGRAAAEGGVTPMEQMVAALGSSPLGPLVKAVQQGWGSVAELARSPYAAPVVMSLMIVGLKLVGSMEADVEEADVTEPGSAAEGAEEEAKGAEEEVDGVEEEADGAAEAAEEEDAIDAAESEGE